VRVAVVGHVEWVEFAEVDEVPSRGQIVEASETWAEPAGGGAVAAVQLARLAGDASFFTALGDDELGERSRTRLAELGVSVHAVARPEPTRRAFVFLDDGGERTITTIGRRLFPRGADPLPWAELGEADAVYLTSGDAEAVRRARAARVLVVTPRAGRPLETVAVDALVYSAHDERESAWARAMTPQPKIVVATEGRDGGHWQAADGTHGRWEAARSPGPLIDQYGSGDSFAAGLTYGLGAGKPIAEAVAIAARCGAWCAAGHGPYESQLRDP
jgi:ribokinase